MHKTSHQDDHLAFDVYSKAQFKSNLQKKLSEDCLNKI